MLITRVIVTIIFSLAIFAIQANVKAGHPPALASGCAGMLFFVFLFFIGFVIPKIEKE